MKYIIGVYKEKKLHNTIPIVLKITLNGKRYFKKLFEVEEKYWDNARKKVKSNHVHVAKLNLKIEDEIEKATDYFLDCERHGIAVNLEVFLKSGKTGTESRLLHEDLKKESEYLYSLNRNRTAEKFKNSARKVFEFDPKATLNISLKWIERYYHYCQQLGNKHNTISKDLEHIKKMVERGVADKLVVDNPFLNYAITRKEGIIEKLTLEEVKIFEAYEPETIPLKMAKEIWLFSMYHWGMRAEDVIFLKKSSINDGVIHNATGKGLGKDHMIDQIYFPTIIGKGECLFDYVQKIPTNQMEREKLKDSINAKINPNLHKLEKLTGINKSITMHVARHTFAYICDDQGLSLNDIAAALGHSSIKTTAKYVQAIKKNNVINDKVKGVFGK